jgi:hypothetical protein
MQKLMRVPMLLSRVPSASGETETKKQNLVITDSVHGRLLAAPPPAYVVPGCVAAGGADEAINGRLGFR